jgi:hypothetical protein
VTSTEIIAMTTRFDMRSIATSLTARAAEVAMDLLGEPNRQLSSERELRFGRKGSLAVVINGTKTGSWYDHEHGVGGDLIDLIQHVQGVTFREAIVYAERIILAPGLVTAQTPTFCPHRHADLSGRRASELWQEAMQSRTRRR